MKAYQTIKQDGQYEIEIKKSRFICHLKRVETEDEARNFIQSIKKEQHKANHNCSSFIIGEEGNTKRSSDDGEPSGTAGIPMLTVLENKELTNVVAVVTRYFGGIKLGSGGLIRAYTDAVATAIKEIGCVIIKEQVGIQIEMTYPQYQNFANWRLKHQLEEYDSVFLETVQTTIYTDKESVDPLLADLEDFYYGKISYSTSNPRIIEISID
ncbi:YigZ family protein [Streptococcus cameli]